MIFWDLFITFFKIGAFTFGGGYAMLPLIQSEVLAHEWMTLEEIIDFIAISESTPGPFAINSATFVGKTVGASLGFGGSLLGAACATLGVVLPSFIVILIVAHFYMKFKESFAVRSVMGGLKPAVIGLLGAAVLSIGKSVFFPDGMAENLFSSGTFLCSVIISALTFFFAYKKKVSPILLIVICAGIGLLLGYTHIITL